MRTFSPRLIRLPLLTLKAYHFLSDHLTKSKKVENRAEKEFCPNAVLIDAPFYPFIWRREHHTGSEDCICETHWRIDDKNYWLLIFSWFCLAPCQQAPRFQYSFKLKVLPDWRFRVVFEKDEVFWDRELPRRFIESSSSRPRFSRSSQLKFSSPKGKRSSPLPFSSTKPSSSSPTRSWPSSRHRLSTLHASTKDSDRKKQRNWIFIVLFWCSIYDKKRERIGRNWHPTVPSSEAQTKWSLMAQGAT